MQHIKMSSGLIWAEYLHEFQLDMDHLLIDKMWENTDNEEKQVRFKQLQISDIQHGGACPRWFN